MVAWTRRHRSALLLALALGVLYVFVAGSTQLFDRDEPRFARAAVEMLRTGDWVVPRFNGNLRPDKPAGVYWLMAPAVKVLGPVELAVRLPSVVGMMLAGLFTYGIGRRLFSKRVGLWAQGMFGTCGLCLWIGTAATADGSLVAGMTAAVYGFVCSLRGGRGKDSGADRVGRWTWAAWGWWVGGLAWAQLVKGPVGLAVPGLAVLGAHAAAVVIRRRTGGVETRLVLGFADAYRRKFWAGVAVSLVPLLAWGAAAGVATDWVLVKDALGTHVGRRMFEASEGHGGSGALGYLALLPLYVPLTVVTFFPWMLHLPAGLSALVRGEVGGRAERAVLWGWALPVFVLMSLVATKLPHYTLGAYPALAILSAATLDAALRDGLGSKTMDWLRGGAWFFGAIALALAGGLLVGPWFAGDGRLGARAALPGLVALSAVVVVMAMQLRGRAGRASVWAVGLLGVTLVLSVLLVRPVLEPAFKISRPLAAALNGHLDAMPGGAGEAVPLAMYGYKEPSLVFYADRPAGQPLLELPGRAELRDWLMREGAWALVVPTDTLAEEVAKLTEAAGGEPPAYRVIAEASVVNYADNASAETVAVVVSAE